MKPLFRTYLALTLAALLTLTGQSIAVARGMPGPSGMMELCTGTGPVMVYVDAQGQPTAPPRYCPDDAFHVLSIVALPDAVTAPPVTLSRLTPVQQDAAVADLRPVPATARAPPAFV